MVQWESREKPAVTLCRARSFADRDGLCVPAFVVPVDSFSIQLFAIVIEQRPLCNVCLYIYIFSESSSHYVVPTQARLKLIKIHLPLPPKCWD